VEPAPEPASERKDNDTMGNPGPHRALGALAVPALLLAAASALAQEATVHGDAASYDAAAGASDACLDFNGSTGALVPGSTFSAAVTFGSPEALDPTTVNWSSDAISDAGSTTAVNGIGTLDGTFTGTAMAFKLVFSSNANAPTVDLYAEDATLIGSFVAPNAPGFFGVVSTVPVKRFVITPGLFDPVLMTRDRFFVDDFCWTAAVAPPAEPAADLVALCDGLVAAVAGADAAAFSGRYRQRALGNKLRVVCARIEDGDAASLCAALRKLEHDLLPKVDGERSPRDWAVDATVRQDLEDRMTALAAALRDAIEALGGCPADGDDDDADPDDEGGPGDGASARARVRGRGNNDGGGNGHGRGHGPK
jgi:hypothetical protein